MAESEQQPTLRERWEALRPIDRGVYGLVVVLVLGAAVGQPVWRLLDQRLALTLAWEEQGASTQDPWGRPLVEGRLEGPTGAWNQTWSVGPNGVDERGGGDDLVVLGRASPRWKAYEQLPIVLLLLGVGLAGGWGFLGVLRRPRSPRLGDELATAGLLTLPVGALFAAIGMGLSFVLDRGVEGPIAALRRQLVVPLPVAVTGSAFALAFLLLLWVRLSQPREDAPAEENPQSQAHP